MNTIQCNICKSTNKYHSKICPHFVSSIKKIKTDKEYIDIKASGSFSLLTIEDMKWIDLNTTDDPNYWKKPIPDNALV